MRKPIELMFLILFLAVSVGFLGAFQQGRGKGRIHGSVEDTAGNPLEGVRITATHIEYGTTFSGKSDENGKWAIAGLGTGHFRITAELNGYQLVHHEMKVSQFSRNNPPIKFSLQKKQAQQLGVPALQDAETMALFEEGNQLFDQEKYPEAAAKFEEFLEKNPTVYQVHVNIGNCYREMGEYDKAIKAYTLMLDKIKEDKGSYAGDQEAARALSSVGETYMKKGELEKAGEYLKQALEIFPQDETLAFNIGEIYFKQGDAAAGNEYFNRAIELNANWPPPYRQRGYAYLNMADYKNALESFKKYVELAPDSPQTPTIKNLIPQLEQMIKK